MENKAAKKSAKRKWLIIAACAVIAIILAVAVVLAVQDSTAEPAEFAPASQTTVDMANIVNGGVAAQGDGCTYYCNNGIWMKPDDGNAVMLWDDYATALMVHDGYLYYTDGQKSNALLRRQLPDGEAEEVVPFSAEYFAVSGDELYFMCAKRIEHRGIYRCALDGSDRTRLSQANCSFIFPYDGKIYYADKDDGYNLKRLGADGTEEATVVKGYVYTAFVNDAENMIYYSTTEGVYRCDLDGKKNELLMPIPAYRLVAADDSLFLAVNSYTGAQDYPTGLFRLVSGADKMKQINTDQCTMLAAGSGKLYYKSMSNGMKLMRSEFDGTLRYEIAGGEADHIFDQIAEAGEAQQAAAAQ